MVTVYKLTTQDNKTRKGYSNECTWGRGVTHSGTGQGDLCSPGYIHAYLSPLLAVFLNPVHADIPNPKLWQCSVSTIAISDKNLKVGAVSLKTQKEIKIPIVTPEQRVIFAILCAEAAQEVVKNLFEGDEKWQITYRQKISEFNNWAVDYKTGKNRADAYAAGAAAYAAAAAGAAADARAAAARAAAYAAYAAAAAGAAADAAGAAGAAADAAGAAADAAGAAAYAAADARAAPLNFVAIAEKAMTYQ